MKVLTIIILTLMIAFLWLMTYIFYKPVFDKVSKEFIIDKQGVKIANYCILVIIALAITIGVLI